MNYLACIGILAAGMTAACGSSAGDHVRRGIDLDAVMIGFVFADRDDSWDHVEREFYLYASPEGGDPLKQLPEINTDAGREGPMFMLGDYDQQTGEPQFAGTAWLEVRAKKEGEKDFVALRPRVRVTAGIPGLVETKNRKRAETAEANGTIAYFRVYNYLEGWSRDEFDPKKWIEATPRSWTDSRRFRMLEDLLSRHTFLGMEREALYRLLGYGGPGKPGESTVEYMVGYISVEVFWLWFRLEDDRVIQMRFMEK